MGPGKNFDVEDIMIVYKQNDLNFYEEGMIFENGEGGTKESDTSVY
jgi:hypothetical protein